MYAALDSLSTAESVAPQESHTGAKISILFRAGEGHPEGKGRWSPTWGEVHHGDVNALQDSANDLRRRFEQSAQFQLADSEGDAKVVVTVTDRTTTPYLDATQKMVFVIELFYHVELPDTGHEFEDTVELEAQGFGVWRDLAHIAANKIELWVYENNSQFNLIPEMHYVGELQRQEILAKVERLKTEDVPEILRRAEDGDAESQLLLGLVYQDGIGVEKKEAQAVLWYRKAAEQGHPMAQCNLACSYAHGEGVKSNYKEAASWYLKAAEQGFWPAQFNLAYLYAQGVGFRQDEDESLRWYRAAAIQGFAPAQFQMGMALYPGPHSLTFIHEMQKSADWLGKARDQGHAPATYHLAQMYHVASKSVSQTDGSEVLLLYPFYQNWETAAAQGHPLAALRLAEHQEEQKNRSEACMWFQVAWELDRKGQWTDFLTEEEKAELRRALDKEFPKLRKKQSGNLVAECETRAAIWLKQNEIPSRGFYAKKLSRGCRRVEIRQEVAKIEPQEVPTVAKTENLEEKLKQKYEILTTGDIPVIEQRAKEGDAESQFLLAQLHVEGRLVQADGKEVVKWHRLAAEQGFWPAELALAEIYHQGQIVVQNYSDALEWYRKAAAQGSLTASYNIGVMYREGHGVKKDYKKAMEWFQEAAHRGNAGAMVAIGSMFDNGQGVELDPKAAADWYRKAAEQGDMNGQYNLGLMYEKGRGLQLNVAEAIRWYRKAIEQGDGGAMNNLGYIYQTGKGVPQNGPEAVRWYLEAIEHQVLEQPAHNLASMYQDGIGLPQDLVSAYMWRTLAHWGSDQAKKECLGDLPKKMTKAQVAEAERRAALWPPSRLSLCATRIDDPLRAEVFSFDPIPGCGGTQSLTEQAISELQGRAEAGDPAAQCWLGQAYTFGQGVRRSESKAERWHRKAAEQGHSASQYALGNFYEYGRGVKRNLDQALVWYRKAAEQGTAQAEAKVGLFYMNQGKHEEAAEWTLKAAERGDLMAQLNVASMYADGRGVPRDHGKSYSWILVARETVCGADPQVWNGMNLRPDVVLLKLRDQEAAKLSSEEKLDAERRASYRLGQSR
jgi:TPR repeat protein